MTGQLVGAGCILLAYAVTVMVSIPWLVTRRRWTNRIPRAAISVWVAGLGSGGIAMVASLGCAVTAASRMATGPRTPLTVDEALGGIGLTLTACLMTAVAGGVGSVAVYRLALASWNRRRLVAGASALRQPSSRRSRVPATIVRSSEPTALSVPGRHPVIMVSSRLRDTLTPAQLEAVVEHERGHLLQHHHLLIQLADLQYRCAPVLPCARSLERSMHLLVELAADDHAARRCGRRTTASALRALGATTGDPALDLRAHRLEVHRTAPRRAAAAR